MVVKVPAGYHRWHDDMGVGIRPSISSGRGGEGSGSTLVSSAGGLAATLDRVLVATVNQPAELDAVFARHGARIAAVVLEAVLHSAGCTPVTREYAARARELCDDVGGLLIFDEIMTGFRHSLHGAEGYLGVRPNLSAFGKAVSNGHVLAMFGGADVHMNQLSPTGPVFYSGTFNGQNLGVAAALATREVLRDADTLPRIHRMSKYLAEGVNALIAKTGVTAVCQHFGGVWCLYCGARAVETEKDLARCIAPASSRANEAFRLWMREHGIYVHRGYVNRGF
jgi:glutamate-1-semialdehyde 2,1-aminomutase